MRNFFILGLFLIFPLKVWSFEVIDDVGQALHFNKLAQRIVSLAPDITEILFAIGAGSQVVGVISGSDYPADANTKPHVGSYSGVDLERVISLQPDLIIVWGRSFAREMSVLKKLGIPIYLTQPRHLTDVPHTLQNLGSLTGHIDKAQVEADSFLKQIDALKQQYQHLAPIRVFYQIGAYNLFTINRESWINQAIELCGGQNIFAGALSIAPQVSWEAIVVARPEVIVSDTKKS